MTSSIYKNMDEDVFKICLGRRTVIELLRDYQSWRRGEGEYKWNEDPSENKEYRLSPRQLGILLDTAITLLDNCSTDESDVYDNYQKKAFSFAAYGNNAMYAYWGLVEECSELLEKAKTFGIAKNLVIGELGDILWMTAAICSENKWSLSDIALTATTGEMSPGRINGCLDELEVTVGKIAGKIAKFIRKHDGTNPVWAECVLELKDDVTAFKSNIRVLLQNVFGCVEGICKEYGTNVEYVMGENIKKLTERKANGVIVGEGDTTAERILNAKKG